MEVWLGVRTIRSNGSQPVSPVSSETKEPSRLPWLYAAAEIVCLLAMLASPLWRAGRLLLVVAALDKLRNRANNPELLSDVEPLALNKSVCIWALASIVEAVALGGLSAAWARWLGTIGIGAAFVGLASTVLAAFPAAVVLAAGFRGYVEAVVSCSKAARVPARLTRRWERLSKYSSSDLEELYAKSVYSYYNESSGLVDDFEYHRLKVRLQTIDSEVLQWDRLELRRRLPEATTTSQASAASQSQRPTASRESITVEASTQTTEQPAGAAAEEASLTEGSLPATEQQPRNTAEDNSQPGSAPASISEGSSPSPEQPSGAAVEEVTSRPDSAPVPSSEASLPTVEEQPSAKAEAANGEPEVLPAASTEGSAPTPEQPEASEASLTDSAAAPREKENRAGHRAKIHRKDLASGNKRRRDQRNRHTPRGFEEQEPPTDRMV